MCKFSFYTNLRTFQVSIAWAFPQKSPYLQLFNYYIAILLQSGSVNKLQREALSLGMLTSKPCEDDGGGGSGSFTKINLNNIMSAFAILLAGIGKILNHKLSPNVS